MIILDFNLYLCNLQDEFVFCWSEWIKKVARPSSALVVVDVQNDFISGSLAIINCPAGQNGEDVSEGLLSSSGPAQSPKIWTWTRTTHQHPSPNLTYTFVALISAQDDIQDDIQDDCCSLRWGRLI